MSVWWSLKAWKKVDLSDHTFQLFGEQDLHQKPEEQNDHDAFNHTLTAEEQHRLPQRLAGVLLVMVRHGANSLQKVCQSLF